MDSSQHSRYTAHARFVAYKGAQGKLSQAAHQVILADEDLGARLLSLADEAKSKASALAKEYKFNLPPESEC